MDLDKQIRISPGSHAALKKFSSENGMTMRDAVAMAVQALSPTIVVAVNQDGDHDIVEAYTQLADAEARARELGRSGFLGRNVSRASRHVLGALYELRKYGPEWKKATGWTAGPSIDWVKDQVLEACVRLEHRSRVLFTETTPIGWAVTCFLREGGGGEVFREMELTEAMMRDPKVAAEFIISATKKSTGWKP